MFTLGMDQFHFVIYIVKGTCLSNTCFGFSGALFWFLRYAILKYYKNNIFRKENLVPITLTLIYIFKIVILSNFQKVFIKKSFKYY